MMVLLMPMFDGKYNEAHTDLIRHHGMSLVAASADLHHVYRTWNPHAAELFISIELLVNRERDLLCRQTRWEVR